MAVTNGTTPSFAMAKPQIIRFVKSGVLYAPSDHGRNEVSVDVERIEETKRMANGTMRKYYVGDVHKFSVGWDMLPTEDARTVDKGMGAKGIENFYRSTPTEFTLVVTYGDGTQKSYLVFFTDFGKELQKRWPEGDYWSISLAMEEVSVNAQPEKVWSFRENNSLSWTEGRTRTTL